MEQVGIENLSKLAVDLGKFGTVVCKLVNKSGIAVLLELIPVVSSFQSIDFKKVKDELFNLSAEEQMQLDTLLKDNFNPPSQMSVVEVKVDKFLDLAEKTRAVIEASVADGKEVYENVKELVEMWKTAFV